MANKRKKVAKKKHVTNRTANKRKTTTTNKVAQTKAIKEWLRTADESLVKKEGDKRGKQKGRRAKRRGK